ncbi:MAG TPA: hypothetical protein PLN21_10340 [Gemmatales bacterium]|nr:hypothetical protein [Gemmatales bacterium]
MNSTTRTELLNKLVTTFHLNVPERLGLALPIRQSELVAIVKQTLLEHGRFSCPLGVLTVLSDNRAELYMEVEVSFSQHQEIRKEFRNAGEAAQEMVRLIINDYLPGNIDGLAIEE